MLLSILFDYRGSFAGLPGFGKDSESSRLSWTLAGQTLVTHLTLPP